MPGKPWTEDEHVFLIANAQSLTAMQIGERLGRSERAVQRVAARMGVSIAHQHRFNGSTINGNTFLIGKRKLLAKTCRRCGKFQPARRFWRIKQGPRAGYWYPYCLSCISDIKLVTRPDRVRAEGLGSLLQDYTLKRANNRGVSWGEEHDRVVRDTEKNLLTVALETGRTYYAVTERASRLGVQRRWNPEQHLQWLLRFNEAVVIEALANPPVDDPRLSGLPTEADWEWTDQTASARSFERFDRALA